MGQVIVHDEIKVSEPWDIDFCSKVSFSSGSMLDWQVYRNPIKTLTTKHYYIKKNAKIFDNPGLHALALL